MFTVGLLYSTWSDSQEVMKFFFVLHKSHQKFRPTTNIFLEKSPRKPHTYNPPGRFSLGFGRFAGGFGGNFSFKKWEQRGDHTAQQINFLWRKRVGSPVFPRFLFGFSGVFFSFFCFEVSFFPFLTFDQMFFFVNAWTVEDRLPFFFVFMNPKKQLRQKTCG